MHNVKWTVSLKGARSVMQRTPVLVADRALLTFNHGAGATRRGTLICVDAASGSERWRFEIDNIINRPAVDATGAIYLTTFGGDVFKLDSRGAMVWTSSPARHNTGAPILCGDVVAYSEIGGGATSTRGVWTADGSIAWSYQHGGHGYALTSDGEVIVHSSVSGGFDQTVVSLLCLDAASGTLRWKIRHPEYLFSPTIHADRVFVGSRGHVICASLPSGEVVARHEIVKGVAALEAPLIAPTGIIFCAENGDVFSLALGTERDARFVANWTTTIGAAIDATPILRDDRLHVIGEDGNIVTLAAGDGTQTATTAIPRFKQGFGLATIDDDFIVAASRECIRLAPDD